MDAELIKNETADMRLARPLAGMTAAPDDELRAEMLAYYWRKGVPSVVLAIVTLVLVGYSNWFVQPNVKQRYRDICARNFLLLEVKDVEKSESKLPWEDEVDENARANAASKRGSDARRRLLEQTQLCLRRLIIWDKSDDAIRFQSAQVANQLADWYLDRARAFPLGEVDRDETGPLVARSLAEREKAADAMRVVQKMDGKFAAKAYLWTTRLSLLNNLEVPSEELRAITTRIMELLAVEENNVDEIKVDAYAILAETFVRLSLRVGRIEDVERQIELQPQVLSFFDTARYASVADLAWASEARSIEELATGQAMATKALQTFWGKGPEEASSVETLSAVFRCLLLVNSIKEAQVFLSERIQQIAAFEQPRFRSLTSAACFRQIMLDANATRQNAGSPKAGQALFSMAVQLNPESEQVLAMLELVGDPSMLGPSGLRLKESIGMASDLAELGPADSVSDGGLRSLLNACLGLRNSPISDSTLATLSSAIKATPVHGIVASRLAMRLVGSDSIKVEDAIKWLSAITDSSPEALVAWSDRAKLHLLKKEYSEAIECLEFMLAKLPGNEQLVEAINSAKSQVP